MALSPDEALQGGPLQLTPEEQEAASWIETNLDQALIGFYPESHKIGKHGGCSMDGIKLFTPAIEAELRRRYLSAGWRSFEVRPMSPQVYKFVLNP